jgi:hypothetical protein
VRELRKKRREFELPVVQGSERSKSRKSACVEKRDSGSAAGARGVRADMSVRERAEEETKRKRCCARGVRGVIAEIARTKGRDQRKRREI